MNSRHDNQRELSGCAIAAKRYAFFTPTPEGGIEIEKASAHGLGYLYAPKPGYDSSADAPIWVVEAWDWILRGILELPQRGAPWLELPAMMRLVITSREVLKVLQDRQCGIPYRDRVKPFNFLLSPIINHLGAHPIGPDREHFTLVTPFTSDPSGWYGLPYVNVHDGKVYRIAPSGRRRPYEALPETYGDVVSQHRWHREAKSWAPDGSPCAPRTSGLLRRTPVTADGIRYIGKETDRRWEQGEDISMLEPQLLEYRPNETARLVSDPDLRRAARTVSIRDHARAAGVTENTVKALRNGKRLRRDTLDKLRKGLNDLLKKGSAAPQRCAPAGPFSARPVREWEAAPRGQPDHPPWLSQRDGTSRTHAGPAPGFQEIQY